MVEKETNFFLIIQLVTTQLLTIESVTTTEGDSMKRKNPHFSILNPKDLISVGEWRDNV